MACDSHLGGMVLALTAWVHEQQLQDAELTVLAIDSVARPATAGTEAEGFAFITFRVTGRALSFVPLVLTDPARAAEQAAEDVMQAVARVSQRVDPVHR